VLCFHPYSAARKATLKSGFGHFNELTMPILRALLSLLALYSGTLWAQVDLSVDCGVARDPERCEARQAALAACADLRSAAKSECIAQYLPPPDCSKASDPAKCEAIQRAKQTCKGQSGKALKSCLRGESPQKAKAKGKTTKKKAAAKKKPGKVKPAAAAKQTQARK
jgi:hypothetical protein